MALFFGHPHALFEELDGWRKIPSCDKCIHRSLIDNKVEFMTFKSHFSGIHDQPLHSGRKLPHLFNDCGANVNIDNIFVACFVHLLRQFAVSAANHENRVLFGHTVLILEGILKLRELSIPVKTTSCLVPFIPEVGFGVIISRGLVCSWILH
jgi:hypothetical protein